MTLCVVDALAAGTAAPLKQDRQLATKAPRLTKEQGFIDWRRSASEIKNLVRGLDPWPRAYCDWFRPGGEPLRIILHRVQELDSPAADEVEPGTVVEAGPRLIVAAGGGAVEIECLQPAGKRPMRAGEFLRGYSVSRGDLFGSAAGA